jgi:uncharacterized protein YsxB (DUF464 family)
MNEKRDKRDVPIIIIVVCASITMLVQTIASAITVMGYDEVIQADAKARAAKILQQTNPNKELETKLTELVKRLEEVEKLAHHSGETK